MLKFYYKNLISFIIKNKNKIYKFISYGIPLHVVSFFQQVSLFVQVPFFAHQCIIIDNESEDLDRTPVKSEKSNELPSEGDHSEDIDFKLYEVNFFKNKLS